MFIPHEIIKLRAQTQNPTVMKTATLILAFMIAGTLSATPQITITGTVTDCEGKPLKGTLVSYKAENKSVVVDSLGNYLIAVRDTNAILSFSYIGYKTKEVKVGGKTKIDVSFGISEILIETGIKEGAKPVYTRKPVIYLYPAAETEVSVRVDYDGRFLFTYPEYGDGWRVTAFPDGRLINKADGREYSYLFWDGLKKYPEEWRNFQTGSVVHRDSTVAFLQRILPELGLHPREYNEFIVYWTPYLMRNEWNFIHFRCGEDYDAVSVNRVTPQPETSIRVFMEFKGVPAYFDVEPQKTYAPERKGFTLVEWGGMEL